MPRPQSPVLFLVFNRPEQTKRVFMEIKKARPTKLFIASDGPRENMLGEKKIVQEIREYILKNITWKCQVKTLFRDKNVGCKIAVSSAITWFFENVKEGIILEDDCLPSQGFFDFCQIMLKKYRNNHNIYHISGTNVEEISILPQDHFFSNCFNVWGWATWKRAWKKYDVKMKDWKNWRNFRFLNFMHQYSLLTKFKSWRLYNKTYSGKIDTWDYQWDFICKKNMALAAIPCKNLITNIGFKQGTHTTNYDQKNKAIKRYTFTPLKNTVLGDKTNPNYSKSYSNFFGKNR